MNPAAMRKRPTQVLLSNVRYIPAQVRRFAALGRHEDAERSARILAESTAELQRRGRLIPKNEAVLSYSPEAYTVALAKWTKDIPAGLST